MISSIYQEHSDHIRGKKTSEAAHICTKTNARWQRSVSHQARNRKGTHRLDAHDKEHWVFVDAWCGVKGLSIRVGPTGDQSWLGKENPDRIESDSEEMSKEGEEGWGYAGGMD